MTRKEMKRRAKTRLKKHYLIFVAACLIGAFLGGEFSGSLGALTSYSSEDLTPESKAAAPGRSLLQDESLVDLIVDLGEQAEKTPQKNAENENPIFGTSPGVFAYLVDAATSGSFLVTAFSALNSLLGSRSVALGILTGLAFLGVFAVWFFVQNMYAAVSRRIFLEGRVYEKVPAQRFLFFFRVKRWAKVSWTMFVTAVLQFLWSLTIVGGIIKHYSYILVPYIAAENSDVKAREAITLSRKMMHGHKWECFVFELTFLGWEALGVLTFGLTAICYSNPYRVASFSEYYAGLREKSLNIRLPGTELLNDRYLFEKPERTVAESAYADVLELMGQPVEDMPELTGFRGFMARNFGILFSDSPKEQAYEKSQADQLLIRSRKEALEGKAYPERLFPLPETEKRPRVETSHYLRHYSIWSLLLMFFLLSFVGWIWEVMLHLVAEHELVNRGMLHGPWLPIYGAGSILILVLLNRLRSRPALEFVSAVVLCGLVEYFTSYFTELTHNGQRWWDYSGYFINLNGRICGEGLLVFGLGGVLVVYLLAPMLDDFIRRIPRKVLIPVCLTLVLCFLGDQAYSSKVPNAGKGITEVQAASSAAALPTALFSEQPVVGGREAALWRRSV